MAKGLKTGGRTSKHPHRINFCVDEAVLEAANRVARLRCERTGVAPVASQVWREAVATGLRALESAELQLGDGALVAEPAASAKPAPKKSTRSKTPKKSAKPTKQSPQWRLSDETLDAVFELSWRRKRVPDKADVRRIAKEINLGHEPNWANAKERQRFAEYCRQNRIRLKLK